MNDGIRVGTIVDSHGERSFVTLPNETIDDARHVEDVASARGRALNELVPIVKALDWETAPGVLGDLGRKIGSAPKVRPGLMAALAQAWRDHPDWQSEVRDEVMEWRRLDRRNWQEQVDLGRRVSRRRLDIYRVAAKELVGRCGLIGIESIGLAEMARRVSRDGKDDEIARLTGWYRRLAAPGELLAAIRMASARDGAIVHEHAGKSTWICADCGAEQEPRNRAELYHSCPRCGRSWDQDVNAARNLLSAALARS